MKLRTALAASVAAVFVFSFPGHAAAEVACPNPIPVVEENACASEGSEGWRLSNANPAIAGFATRTSVNRGENVVLKIGRDGEPADTTTADVDVYRIGYYGGEDGILIPAASEEAVTVNNDQGCGSPNPTTGLLSCADWDPTYTIPASSLRASGLYVAHITATDTGWDNQIIFVVRDDERAPLAEVLVQVPISTYEAYNNWGGKSLYDFNSSGGTTISGSQRAVKVSFDRPFANTTGYYNDWFLNTDLPLISWLEHQGYDVSYTDDLHTHADAADLGGHSVVVLGGHDEYWSQEEFKAVEAARDEGISVASFGANTAYWKVRYEDSGRTLVCYKTVAGSTVDGSTGANDWGPDGVKGTADDALGADGIAGTKDDRPQNSTTTFRDNGAPPGDPNAPPGGRVGPDMPENSLFGTMYFGDDDGAAFSLEVPAAEGDEFAGNGIWRHTDIDEDGATINAGLIGWEWDAVPTQPQYLSRQPAGVERLSESHPEGTNWLQDEGRVYGPAPPPGQPGVANAVKYTAKSGAIVFAAGTDQWNWGLGPHFRAGAFTDDPFDFSDSRIEQATANLFADMKVEPHTPEGIVLDGENQAPKAAFTATPSPALVGDEVSFDAAGSSDADGEVVHYEWDLDGNGSFETDTGTTSSATHTYVGPGTPQIKLRVSDDEGATDTVAHTLSVTESSSDPYPEIVQGTEGIAHYWRLGESSGSTFADLVGGSNAANNGAALGATGALAEDPDTAASFDGNDSATASVDLSGTDKLTIEFWLKWDQFADDDALALELTENFNQNDGGILVDPNSSSNGGGKFEVAIGRNGSRNNAFFTRPSADEYHHYAFVLDTSAPAAQEIVPYVDGAPVPFGKSVSNGGAGNFADALLRFMSRGGSQLFGSGDLDELAIYSRKLSAAEIEDHYELGTGVSVVPNVPPKAAFTATPSPALVGEEVSFDAKGSSDSDGVVVHYEWDLDGNGSFETDTGTTPSATHTYAGPGTPHVKLRVSDDDGATGTVEHILSVTKPSSAPYPEAVLGTEGIAHYWRMGESSGSTFADIAGGADASNSGAALGAIGALAEDPDTAASFDGNDSAAASVDLSKTNKLTIEFWLKWDQFADNDALALELTENFNQNDGGILVDPNSSSNGGGGFEVAIGRGSARNNAFFARPSAGVYHHYTFVLDSAASGAQQIVPYIDGVPVSYVKTLEGTGAGNFADALLRFMSRGGSQLFGSGDLDDLAIYSRKLSVAEIEDHYELGTGGSEEEVEEPPVSPYPTAVLGSKSIAHYWRMGESSGSVFADIAGGATAANKGATLGVAGALAEDPDTAAGFKGSNSAWASVDLSKTDKLTIEFWLKWDQFLDNDALALELTENFNLNDGGILVDPNSSSNSGGKFEVAIGRGSSRNNAFFTRPGAGTYHHYAFVLDTAAPGAQQIVPYIDGVPVSYVKTLEGTGAGNFADALLRFMSRGGTQLFGSGDLDDLAIYAGKLTPEEIEAHYELGTGG